ncbi:uncharacterized protein B0I36DRAFT_328179 [Microdochium trichocladiopsis]|uniref:Potassium channel domain-containing protein n=1 Tax=Microdochium trichocladiopsis TaxID=1682393 RepID=A0A9P8Y2W6_9PEZI|nr:uncharacterized protein B0I36DRAFT_328179 [Microdochium trichocladiopsis]KAH7027903.1 hypothetical protein B0I36DRAFT_328179 [Microdochium trichocladiopsis]
MDDGDLGKPISETCNAVDSRVNDKDGDKQHDPSPPDDGPTRYWLISAAFPMIAGTLGPVASAFSICALVEKWRAVIPPGAGIQAAYPIPDPLWLYIINAVQLAIALIANLFLLLNMAKRVRFSIAQPITIAGWYFSAVCLVALAATAAGPLQDEKTEGDMIWSQAFYYGIFAALLYFIVASLMSVTIWGANAGHYSKDFKLTPSQRTLMLQTILFLMYLLLGALLFSNIEGWAYLDGVYWADVTLFTVGFGDYSPATTLGRALMMPYALIGITSLGLVIGSIRSMVLDRGKTQLDARALERKRRHFIRRLLRKEQQGILEPIDGDALVVFPELKGKRLVRSEFERRGAEFNFMRRIQAQASRRRRWTAMGISTSTLLVLWLVGAKVFESCEAQWQGWSYFDAMYFAYTGLTTIGFGDLTPVSNPGKAFFVIWSLLALPTMTVLISNAGDTIVRLIRDGTLKLGNLTILPGEMSFSKEAKMFLHKVTLGLFPAPIEDFEPSPPGFFGFGPRPQHPDSEADEETADGQDSGEGLGRARNAKYHDAMGDMEHEEDDVVPSKSAPMSKAHDEKEEIGGKEKSPPYQPSRAEYHLVLIDEICKVTQHLREQPPRKYSYAEWAWYLRLIGEDEASAETHGTAHAPKKRQLAFGRRRRAVRIDGTEQDADANENAIEEEDHEDIDVQQEEHEKKEQLDHSTTDTHNGGGGGGNSEINDGQGGEAEAAASSSETIRHTAQIVPETQGHREGAEADKTKWSWIGTKSPLLDARDEAEWILDRLEERLRKELAAVAVASGYDGVRVTAARQGEDLEKRRSECQLWD